MKKYSHVSVAGTFDHFHKGQKTIIKKAFEVGEKVSVGIARRKLTQRKILVSRIQPLRDREKAVKEYIKKKGWSDRAEYFVIEDIYGIAKHDKTLQALVVTDDTKSNAEKINKYRAENELPKLDLVKIPFVKGNDNKAIHSDRIRFGEINRLGHSYLSLFVNKDRLVLPKHLRPCLREPFGEVYKKLVKEDIDKHNPVMTIAIGDVVTLHMQKIGIEPNIQCIDFKTKREDIIGERVKLLPHCRKVDNPPGTVTKDTAYAFEKAFADYFTTDKPQQIFVNGEEDLTALVVFMIAPLQSIVLYGHFQMGVVLVEITEEKKKEIEELLAKFK